MKPYRIKEIDDLRARFKHLTDAEAFLDAMEGEGVSAEELSRYTKAKKKRVDMAREAQRS